MQAAEQLSLEQARQRLAKTEQDARNLLPRLCRAAGLDDNCRLLDVGAAQGRFVIAARKMGFDAHGVEPWDQARQVAKLLGRENDMDVELVEGVAEKLPIEDNTFDIVTSSSVIEHVLDAQTSFAEAFRVLRPGGIYWFFTASSVCPRQREIAHLPLFGWYPDPLKQRIMSWAVQKKPHWVGNTTRPAIHWFTPWKARRMLRRAGFKNVFDRWDLGKLGDAVGLKKTAFSIIGSCGLTKLMADVLKPECEYAAIKPDSTSDA